MITQYDYDNNFVEKKCSICGYKYKEYYRSTRDTWEKREEDKRLGFGEEDFICGETEFIFQEEQDYAPPRLCKKIIYACPKCGALQIEV